MSESYIGLAPSYGVFQVQRIAGTTATTYDLDFEVAQATQLLVSIDGIVQEPDYAFTIGRSSTGQMQLTFSSALSVTSLTCSTTANSATVGVSSSANLNVGQSISGTGIPANSFISTIASATSITISNVATNTSGSVALSFGSRVFVVYLGKQLLTPSTDQADTTPLVEHFNGGASSYSLSRTPPNQSSILVFVHGVFQRGGAGKAYTLSGSTINFGSATPSGTDAVTVHYVATENNSVPTVADASITNAKLNLDYSDATYRAPTKVTTTAGQTTQAIKQISATRYYDENDVLVLLNGICLIPDDDYTISTTTLTLTGGAPPTGSSLVVRYLAL